MRVSRSLALATTLAVLGPAFAAESDPAARLVGIALADGAAWRKLAWLTDRIGHRLSGSPGYDAAVRWAVEEFRRDGMSEVWAEKVVVPHWVRGKETGRILEPVDAPLAITALGMSVPTPDGGVTGEVIETDGLEGLKSLGERVRGKIVLFNRPIRRDGGPGWGYGAGSEIRHRGASAAARLGAIGTMLRSLGTASYRLPHTGGMAYENDAPRIPASAISAEDADHIHRLLQAGEKVRVRFELGCQTLPDVESASVVADLRGRERPEEIVLLGCHLDSWDLGHGAIDDGAGCAIIMDAARVIAASGLRPRRTVRVVFFANEENGLRGAKAYAKAHEGELPRHVAALEVDSGGGTPQGFGVNAGPGGEEIVRRIAAPLAAIGASAVKIGGGGADIDAMRPAGVPQMSIRQDTSRYFDYHHTAADTLDKLDPKDLALNVAAVAAMAYGLADDPATLPRIPPEPHVEKPSK